MKRSGFDCSPTLLAPSRDWVAPSAQLTQKTAHHLIPGISYLVDGIRYLAGRPTLRVRVFQDNEQQEVGGLQFEIENIGGRTTSLEPSIQLTYWALKKGKLRKKTAHCAIRDVDRDSSSNWDTSRESFPTVRASAWSRSWIARPS